MKHHTFKHKTGEETEVNVTIVTHHPLFFGIKDYFEQNTQFFVTPLQDDAIKLSGKWVDIEVVISILGYTSKDLKDCIAFCEASLKDYLTDVWFYDIEPIPDEVVEELRNNQSSKFNNATCEKCNKKPCTIFPCGDLIGDAFDQS